MIYLILFISLAGLMAGYIVLAKRLNIIDKPNKRSSHSSPTVRGGGIIFPIAVLLWAALFDHSDWYLVVGVVLMGFIGFLDDRFSLSQFPRLIFQSVAVLLIIYEMGFFQYSLFYAAVVFILITGWINTFNFMDGINGISVLYACSVLLGVYLFYNELKLIPVSMLYIIGLSLVTFGFYNIRKNALAFAGDVGSLSMGLILAYLVSSLIISSGRWEFILLVSVYGVDSVLTIIHRLFKKENIFEAHRSHLYQYLANEWKWGHIPVAMYYATMQMVIIVGLLWLNTEFWQLYSILVLLLLTSIYILLKVIVINSLCEN